MKWVALALLAVCSAWPVSAQADKRFEQMLKRIDPSERLEQVCEYAALTKIGHDNKPLRPDRVVMDSISPPKVAGDNMSGSGAALRSHGKWYQFEFTCHATPDRLSVQSFSYRVGEPIPENEWERFGLWR
jgi:hypothetical protein